MKSALYIRQELSSIEIFSGSSFLSPSLFESNQNLVVITGSKSIWGFRGTSSTWSSFLIHIHSLTSVYAYKKLETSENSLFERLNKTYEQCRSNTGVIYFWIPRNNPPPRHKILNPEAYIKAPSYIYLFLERVVQNIASIEPEFRIHIFFCIT